MTWEEWRDLPPDTRIRLGDIPEWARMEAGMIDDNFECDRCIPTKAWCLTCAAWTLSYPPPSQSGPKTLRRGFITAEAADFQ